MSQIKGIGKRVYNDSRLQDYNEEMNGARGPLDLPFLLLTLLLLTIGVIMVLSASFARAYYESGTGGNPTYYFTRQLIFALGGVGIMYIASRFPLSFYRAFSFPVLLLAIGSLILVLVIGVGKEEVGAKRWIDLGFTTFQPSEIAKLAVILTFASMICTFKKSMSTFKYGVVPFALVLIVIVGLLALEPHLSASLIIIMVGALMMFIGGMNLKLFAGGIAAVAGLFVVAVIAFPHASSRVTVWRDPMADLTGDGWQIVQSLYAIGSGGLMGNGLGQSRQKYLYLPEEHNDFIFSVICEELGFIGAVLILALFALLIIRGYWLAMHAKDRYSFLVCVGLTTLLALQVILNVAVVTNLVPSTGISLPFFSYGGTALLMQMGQMGIILSVSRDIPAKSAG